MTTLKAVVLRCGVARGHQNEVIDTDALQHGASVPVTLDFDPNRIIGTASVAPASADGTVEATISLQNAELAGRYWPSVGFTVSETSEENGIRTIHSGKLVAIGLSQSPNVDPSIPPIIFPKE